MEARRNEGYAVAFDSILTLARDNDAAGVEALLRRGAPAGYQNRVGQTPLHIAAMWGSIEAAKVLLEARADPNTPNRLRGSTPLHAAALGRGVAEKRSFCARLMIQAKGDPRRGDFEGELPMDMATDEVVRVALGAAPLLLHKAVELRQLKALSEALEQITSGAVDLTLETQNPRGESALFAARAWPEGLKVLLEARCDVNTTNHARRSPLHVAVLAGDLRTTQLLLDAKADVTIKDMDIDRDPRYISKNQQETPAEHRTALHHAAALGNPLLVKLLLQARASVDAVDSQQMTALHLCAVALEEEDLEVGVGVTARNLQSRPEWNGRQGSVIGESIERRWPVLLEGSEEGVKLKAENVRRAQPETLQLLLEAGADANLGNSQWGEGRSLLHEAAHRGDVWLAQRLLAAKGAVDQQDKQGLTALHLAARGKRPELLRLLVAEKADVNLQSGGKTAAELGAINGLRPELLALLRGEAEPVEPAESELEVQGPELLKGMSAEQRAMLFID